MGSVEVVKFFEERGARALAAASAAMDLAREERAEAGLAVFLGVFAPSPGEIGGDVQWLKPSLVRVWLERLAHDIENNSGFNFARGEFHVDPMAEFRAMVSRSAKAVLDELGVAAPPPAPIVEPVTPVQRKDPPPQPTEKLKLREGPELKRKPGRPRKDPEPKASVFDAIFDDEALGAGEEEAPGAEG